MKIKKLISIFVSICILSTVLPIISVFSDTSNLMYESFDSYSDDFYSSWITENTDNVVLADSGYNDKAMVLNSSTLSTIYVKKTLDTPITSDCFTVEMYVKGSGNAKLCFVDEAGKDIYVAGWSEDNSVTYSKNGANRLSSIGDECKFSDISARWNKLKLTVNKTAKTYKFVTGSGSTEKEFTVALGDIYGIKLILGSGMGKTLLADEISVYDGEKSVQSVWTDYSDESTNTFGAVFFTEDEVTDSGLSLQCATQNASGNYNVKKDNGRVKIDVDADAALSCDDYKNIFIDVKYKDSGYGWFYLEYKNTSGETVTTESVCLYDTGEQKTKTFKLSDVSLNKSKDGIDFEISTHTVEQNYYDRATSYRDFSLYTVYISSIDIYHNNTYSPIEVNVNTDNAGNIFFGEEVPSFNISLENKAGEEKSVAVEIRASMYDRNMSPTEIDLKSEECVILAGAKQDISYSCDVSKYGLYVLDITISDESGKICDTKSIPFSKCVKNDLRNESMGVNIHSANPDNSDPEIVMELADKSGIGTLRDSFFWYYYEKEPGVYSMSPEQEALLDAAIKYDMDLLALPLGNNGIYSEYMLERLMTKEGALKYGDFLYNLLKEPKFIEAVDRIEIWNEPDIHTVKTVPDAEVDATNVSNYENYQYRAKLYSDVLMEGYKGIKKAEAETSKEYIAGALSVQAVWFYASGKYFADCVFDYCQKSEDADEFNNGQYFDTISVHPYWGDDPEKGESGVWYPNRCHGLAETMEGFRGLATGGMEFKTGIDEWQTATGAHTGNTYSFELSEGMWHTEYGLSTAIHPNNVATGVKNTGTESAPVYEIQADREWLQAENLIRGFDCVKAMNFDDKLWFYDFIDDGKRDNEHEYNFGILHNWNDEVPYAAKYSYLTMAAYNKLTQGATKATMYDDYEKYGNNTTVARLGSKLAFITKYESPKRNVYMLRTTKSTTQYINPASICESFPTNSKNLHFYDMLGNKISVNDVTLLGRYKLTQTPFYVVEGEDIDFSDMAEIQIVSDGAYKESESAENIEISSLKAAVNFSGAEPESYTVIAALYKDDKLVDLKAADKASALKNDDFKEFSDFGFSENTDFDKLKIMVISDFESLKPITENFESD